MSRVVRLTVFAFALALALTMPFAAPASAAPQAPKQGSLEVLVDGQRALVSLSTDASGLALTIARTGSEPHIYTISRDGVWTIAIGSTEVARLARVGEATFVGAVAGVPILVPSVAAGDVYRSPRVAALRAQLDADRKVLRVGREIVPSLVGCEIGIAMATGSPIPRAATGEARVVLPTSFVVMVTCSIKAAQAYETCMATAEEEGLDDGADGQHVQGICAATSALVYHLCMIPPYE